MNSRINIYNELKQLDSKLPADVQPPVFDLPEGYFENFASKMLAMVRLEDADVTSELNELSPMLAGLPKKMPFDVPQDYFVQEILLPDTEETSPRWLSAARTNPYKVPSGYFDGFAAQMLEQVVPRQAKVAPMFSRTWVRYAAAAVVIGGLVLGAFQFGNNKAISPETQSHEWVAKKLDAVSNQELDAFILSTEPTGSETAKQARGTQTEVRKMLTDVPDGELDAFLNGLPAGNEQIN